MEAMNRFTKQTILFTGALLGIDRTTPLAVARKGANPYAPVTVVGHTHALQ
jgi:hypothetical protein